MIGAQCIQESVSLKRQLPKISELPVFSREFEGVVVSTTGFMSDEKVASLFIKSFCSVYEERISWYVRFLYGKVGNGLGGETTHLIAHSPGSVKYRVCLNKILSVPFLK